MSGEMLLAELLAQLLRPVYGQAVVCPVPWVKADDIVMAFHIFPFLVFLIAEIGSHTGNGEILAPAVEGRNAVILPRYQPPVFIKGGLHGKLIMFKGEVLLGCAIIRIFRAFLFNGRYTLKYSASCFINKVCFIPIPPTIIVLNYTT